LADLTLQSLLADESLRRWEFPVAGEQVYLAHAAVCPLPACVARAVSAYVGQAAQAGQYEYLHRDAENQARALAAEMLGASAEEIAFVPSTSAGLSLVAAGLDWRPGDGVVIAGGDFPANVYPWLELERRGVQVRRIPPTPTGQVTCDDVLAHLDARTRLVSLSTLHYATGAPLDVDAVGQELQARGILFCVDAIQTLGALPCPVRHVDFLVADGHKWLLGPSGIGVLYVRRERMDQLRPVLVGWNSAEARYDYSQPRLDLARTARRYEPGSPNILGIVGLHAALTLLRTIGLPAITDRLRALRSFLLAGLEARSCHVEGIADPDCPTCITSFHHPTQDTVALYRQLGKRKVRVTLRETPAGQKCLRVSPHFYNTEQEIETLLSCL
jgi:selenocysteine lyase/cysteine desulfurase